MSIGDTEYAEHYLAGLGERYRDRGQVRIATAVLPGYLGDGPPLSPGELAVLAR